MNDFLGYCYAYKEKLKIDKRCCDSCHEDHEEGLCDLIEKHFKNGFYLVCCRISNEN